MEDSSRSTPSPVNHVEALSVHEPCPADGVSSLFLDALRQFHVSASWCQLSLTVNFPPKISGKPVDLHVLLQVVRRHGGFDVILRERNWAAVWKQFCKSQAEVLAVESMSASAHHSEPAHEDSSGQLECLLWLYPYEQQVCLGKSQFLNELSVRALLGSCVALPGTPPLKGQVRAASSSSSSSSCACAQVQPDGVQVLAANCPPAALCDNCQPSGDSALINVQASPARETSIKLSYKEGCGLERTNSGTSLLDANILKDGGPLQSAAILGPNGLLHQERRNGEGKKTSFLESVNRDTMGLCETVLLSLVNNELPEDLSRCSRKTANPFDAAGLWSALKAVQVRLASGQYRLPSAMVEEVRGILREASQADGKDKVMAISLWHAFESELRRLGVVASDTALPLPPSKSAEDFVLPGAGIKGSSAREALSASEHAAGEVAATSGVEAGEDLADSPRVSSSSGQANAGEHTWFQTPESIAPTSCSKPGSPHVGDVAHVFEAESGHSALAMAATPGGAFLDYELVESIRSVTAGEEDRSHGMADDNEGAVRWRNGLGQFRRPRSKGIVKKRKLPLLQFISCPDAEEAIPEGSAARVDPCRFVGKMKARKLHIPAAVSPPDGDLGVPLSDCTSAPALSADHGRVGESPEEMDALEVLSGLLCCSDGYDSGEGSVRCPDRAKHRTLELAVSAAIGSPEPDAPVQIKAEPLLDSGDDGAAASVLASLACCSALTKDCWVGSEGSKGAVACPVHSAMPPCQPASASPLSVHKVVKRCNLQSHQLPRLLLLSESETFGPSSARSTASSSCSSDGMRRRACFRGRLGLPASSLSSSTKERWAREYCSPVIKRTWQCEAGNGFVSTSTSQAIPSSQPPGVLPLDDATVCSRSARTHSIGVQRQRSKSPQAPTEDRAAAEALDLLSSGTVRTVMPPGLLDMSQGCLGALVEPPHGPLLQHVEQSEGSVEVAQHPAADSGDCTKAARTKGGFVRQKGGSDRTADTTDEGTGGSAARVRGYVWSKSSRPRRSSLEAAVLVAAAPPAALYDSGAHSGRSPREGPVPRRLAGHGCPLILQDKGPNGSLLAQSWALGSHEGPKPWLLGHSAMESPGAAPPCPGGCARTSLPFPWGSHRQGAQKSLSSSLFLQPLQPTPGQEGKGLHCSIRSCPLEAVTSPVGARSRVPLVSSHARQVQARHDACHPVAAGVPSAAKSGHSSEQGYWVNALNPSTQPEGDWPTTKNHH